MLYPLLHPSDSSSSSSSSSPPEASANSELAAYSRVIAAFRAYGAHSQSRIAKKRADFARLPLRQRSLIADQFLARLDAVEKAISVNQLVLDAVADSGEDEQGGDDHEPSTTKAVSKKDEEEPSEGDMDKIRSTLRQFVRDWAAEGQPERDATYNPVIAALESRFSHLSPSDRSKIKVLVPGAGLGRLAFEIVRRGYTTQGNEYSFFMLIPSNYILNRLREREGVTIHPWLHTFSNLPTVDAQVRGVMIPDTPPAAHIPPDADFSMVAGDFVEVYNHKSERQAWDVVATCYFVDTGRNILAYVETIAGALKSGGVWINIGPLLYHFEGMMGESSLELNLDEVLGVVERSGFVIEERGWKPSTYTGNPEGMLKYEYNCAFWVARKV